MKSRERRFLLPLAELIDRLTIDQIKEVLIADHRDSFAGEMENICHDIDLIIEEKGLKISHRVIRIIIALAQMNLHIWYNKDQMQKNPEAYLDLLKLSHQINGIRNQLKNILLEETGDKEKNSERTNFNTDGLEGWGISIR